MSDIILMTTVFAVFYVVGLCIVPLIILHYVKKIGNRYAKK